MSALRLSVVVVAMAVLSSPALAKKTRWQCVYPGGVSPDYIGD